MTLGGMRPLDPAEPASHLSYYEADAFATWAGRRLPTEAEWEHAAVGVPVEGDFVDAGWLQPRPAGPQAIAGMPRQLFGDCWEWTVEPIHALSGLPRARRTDRRVQRQVHGEPDGVARWQRLRHAATSGQATATSGTRINAGSSRAFDWRRIAHEPPSSHRPCPTHIGCATSTTITRHPPTCVRRCWRGWLSPRACRPSSSMIGMAHSSSMPSPSCPSTTLPAPEIGILAEHGGDGGQARTRPGAGGARQRQQPQDPDPARGPGPRRSICPWTSPRSISWRPPMRWRAASGPAVEAVCADYSGPFELPLRPDWGTPAAFFPGSSISPARTFRPRPQMRRRGPAQTRGRLLIGVDLLKDAVLEAPATTPGRDGRLQPEPACGSIGSWAPTSISTPSPTMPGSTPPRPAPPGRSGADRDAPGLAQRAQRVQVAGRCSSSPRGGHPPGEAGPVRPPRLAQLAAAPGSPPSRCGPTGADS